MKKIRVNLGKHSYTVHVGVKLELLGRELKGLIDGRKALIVTNGKVGGLYYKKVCRGLKAHGFEVYRVTLPDGEAYKTLESVKKIYDAAVRSGLGRKSAFVALGGGVIGDITGFAAATFLRGVPYIQVPTTLLAMVDSSVGGKTGVDMPLGKNLIGAFYQPKTVWIDLSALDTLPERHMRNGLAEVIKYGIISDAGFFGLLEKTVNTLRQLEKIICACLKIKAGVVESDEFEEKGLREILNFGHTFAHAIETLTGYRKFLHGEAVAIGMNMASELASKLGIFKWSDALKVQNLIRKAGLPAKLDKKMDPNRFLSVMKRDKKAREGSIRFVLPVGIGRVKLCPEVPLNLIREVLK